MYFSSFILPFLILQLRFCQEYPPIIVNSNIKDKIKEYLKLFGFKERISLQMFIMLYVPGNSVLGNLQLTHHKRSKFICKFILYEILDHSNLSFRNKTVNDGLNLAISVILKTLKHLNKKYELSFRFTQLFITKSQQIIKLTFYYSITLLLRRPFRRRETSKTLYSGELTTKHRYLPICFLDLKWTSLKLLMNFKSAPAFSLSKSLKKSITQMVPHNPAAPGPIYNISGLGHRQPSLSQSIGKSQRTSINHRIQQTPSPLHYDPKKLSVGGPKTFAKSSFIEQANFNPDPACYITDDKHTTQKVLAYTLSNRYPSIMEEINKNPGPADYQSLKPLPILSRSKNAKQTSFGTSSRFKQEANENPGAGQYSGISSKLSQFEHKYSISKAEREAAISLTPGPSDYHKASFVQQSIKGKLGKSLGSRFKTTLLTERTTINAFHKYLEDPESLFATSKASPKYSMGKGKRQFIKVNQNPGPTEYINNDFLAKHSSTALIPRSEHVEYTDSVFKPGPGTYQIEGEKGLQYSFPRSKSLATVGTVAPGAGRYDLEAKFPSKGPIFGKSERFSKEGGLGAGVGQYDLQLQKEFKGSMSKSSRFKNHHESTPGPGDYHIQSLIGLKSQIDK